MKLRLHLIHDDTEDHNGETITFNGVEMSINAPHHTVEVSNGDALTVGNEQPAKPKRAKKKAAKE